MGTGRHAFRFPWHIIGRRHGYRRPEGPSRAATVLGTGIVLSLVAACGADAAPKTTAGSTSARPTAQESIEQIAARMGCAPQMRGKPSDYRQAVCATGSDKYVLNAFDTRKGQRDWLESSVLYGGTYLIGKRWIVVSGPEPLKKAHAKLGGRIHDAESLKQPGALGRAIPG